MYEYLIYFIQNGFAVFLFTVPAFVLSLLAGEYVRAMVIKNYLGYEIPRNPKEYLSVSGTIVGCIFGYGWAKKREYNDSSLSKGKRLVIALSGFIGNICFTVILLLIQAFIMTVALWMGLKLTGALDWTLFAFNIFIWSSTALAFTRLLIIPGFDGYDVVKILFFDRKNGKKLRAFENSGKWIFFILALFSFLLYAIALANLSILLYVVESPTSALLTVLGKLQTAFVNILTNYGLNNSGWLIG